MAFMSLIAVGVTTLYDTIAYFDGQHWQLTDDEAIAFTNKINDALEALPGEYYAAAKQFIEKYLPFLSLAVTASAITIPRIQYSRELKQQAKRSQGNHIPETGPVSEKPADDTGAVNGTAYRTATSFR